ncbi:hypothetical protein QSH46_021810 [Xanthomonas arboricola pv. juglandis]|nr:MULTISPECIES: hypothetical protein [Xanthomonas]CAD2254868.1 hypothetical protein X12_001210 [Xanthomonas arboricola]MDN0222731.1 hypothetical protein [Xanthomonas arboricola pv. juglandis]MDN0226974.1 hypothetical protein [Xanthomonas arboricola pv. juglandis]MDN0231247.1 hypothetical protein [Xanthomonas arboricola pv. juglandis]MDN0235482.1 hypothetical protein [Xanthomonas arboricola pv. juglandis]
MQQVQSAMRLAFAKATQEVPKEERDRTYAMVRSASNRQLGVTRRKTMWSVERVSRR